MGRPKAKVLLVSDVTIGADIEVFLQSKQTLEIISAEGIIKGTKHEPYFWMQGNPFFATSLDNIMAEFCIPPAKTEEEFDEGIGKSIAYLANAIPPDARIRVLPSAIVHSKFLQTENAKLFGCDPDFNAWLMGEMNPRPEASSTNIRSCGGHIHVGYKKPTHETSLKIVRAMDIFLGLPSIVQEPDNDRKRLYGKAGAFRAKSYGVEYRTISNYYAASSDLSKWAFQNTMSAVDFVNAGSPISEEEGRAIQRAINNDDRELATDLCKYFGVKLAA